MFIRGLTRLFLALESAESLSHFPQEESSPGFKYSDLGVYITTNDRQSINAAFYTESSAPINPF